MKTPDSKRRLFLKLIGAAGFLLAVPSLVWGFFVKHFPIRTVEEKNFSFNPDTGMLIWDQTRKEPYSLTVEGLVDAPARFSYADLRAFNLVNQVSDFHCVEGWSVNDVRWGGFRFEELVKRVKPKPDAAYAVFHSLGKTTEKPGGYDHYLESFSLRDLLDPKQECLLALSLDDKPLPLDHGAPLRLVAPYQYAYKNIKFITRIEFTAKPRPGWWTEANPIYPMDAPVPEEVLKEQP